MSDHQHNTYASVNQRWRPDLHHHATRGVPELWSLRRMLDGNKVRLPVCPLGAETTDKRQLRTGPTLIGLAGYNQHPCGCNPRRYLTRGHVGLKTTLEGGPSDFRCDSQGVPTTYDDDQYGNSGMMPPHPANRAVVPCMTNPSLSNRRSKSAGNGLS